MFRRWLPAGSVDTAESLKNQGNAALARNEPAAAEGFYRRSIELDPAYMPAHYNLGNVLRTRGQLDEALACYRRAQALAPDDYDILVNLGVTLDAQARHDEALDAFGEAARLRPGGVEVTVNRGVALGHNGRHAEAIAAYDEALAVDPGLSIARYYRAMEHLLLGRLQQGFLEFEARLHLPGWVPQEMLAGSEEWDGRELEGRTLLVYPERGMGDMLHFLRYARLCRQRGAHVLVCCHRPLARLLASSPELDRVFADGDAAPIPFGYHVSVMSLPYVFGGHLEKKPLQLQVGPEAVPVIASAAGLKVGLCWQGSPGHARDRERSVGAAAMQAALADVQGVSFFDLQIPATEPQGFGEPLAPLITDFADTARLVPGLDLVITVDTSLAHLCGTLGVPTWVLVTHAPDFRWGLGSEGTPWYDSIRLFRQERVGDWTGVLERVRGELARLAGRN